MLFILTLIIVLFIIVGCIFSYVNALKIRNLRLDLDDSDANALYGLAELTRKIEQLESQGAIDV